MRLIDSSIVTFEASISEEEIKHRLSMTVMEDLGHLREGKMPPGTTVKVLRGEGGKGGYRVRITRDMKLDTTPRITSSGGSK